MNVQHVPVFVIVSLLKHIYITFNLQIFPNTSKPFLKKIITTGEQRKINADSFQSYTNH